MDAKELGNEAAFARPVSELSYGAYGGFEKSHEQDGLTKREYFAGLALEGITASDFGMDMSKQDWSIAAAQLSVMCADALLAELAKERPK